MATAEWREKIWRKLTGMISIGAGVPTRASDGTWSWVVGGGEGGGLVLGTTAGTACEGDDPRLSDARSPTTHGHAAGDVSGLGSAALVSTSAFEPAGAVSALAASVDADPRMSDARAPTIHTHDYEATGAAAAALTAAQSYADGAAAGAVSTHAALTTTHGISAFMATVLDDADAAAARATLGIVGGSGPSVALKAADQTFNSTTPVAVSSLSFAVTSGRRYRFEFVIVGRSDTLTVGIGLALTAPANNVFAYSVRAGGLAADGAGGETQGAGTASGDAVLQAAVAAINTDYVYEVRGIIEPTANGTLQLTARTETGTTVVTVRRASVGYLWDNG